jgi:hypothetical protein
MSPVIYGVFFGEQHPYDPSRHRVQLQVTPHPQFEKKWQAMALFSKVEGTASVQTLP